MQSALDERLLAVNNLNVERGVLAPLAGDLHQERLGRRLVLILHGQDLFSILRFLLLLPLYHKRQLLDLGSQLTRPKNLSRCEIEVVLHHSGHERQAHAYFGLSTQEVDDGKAGNAREDEYVRVAVLELGGDGVVAECQEPHLAPCHVASFPEGAGQVHLGVRRDRIRRSVSFARLVGIVLKAELLEYLVLDLYLLQVDVHHFEADLVTLELIRLHVLLLNEL